MSTYTLSGSGIQSLSAGTGALHVTLVSVPDPAGNGGANPLDYYGVGVLRAGDSVAFWEPFTVCGGPQWIGLPTGTTRIGYALPAGVTISVAEVAAPSPLALALDDLSDVVITSATDTQVLTYQSSTAKWINANPPSGGGGGGGATSQLLNYAYAGADIASAVGTGGVWNDLPGSAMPNQTFTPTSSTALLLVVVNASVLVGETSNWIAARLLFDSAGTQVIRLLNGQMMATTAPQVYANPLVGTAVAGPFSTAAHTVKLQLLCATNPNFYLRPSNGREFLQVRLLQLP